MDGAFKDPEFQGIFSKIKYSDAICDRKLIQKTGISKVIFSGQILSDIKILKPKTVA
jgi:hypothetical protein